MANTQTGLEEAAAVGRQGACRKVHARAGVAKALKGSTRPLSPFLHRPEPNPPINGCAARGGEKAEARRDRTR